MSKSRLLIFLSITTLISLSYSSENSSCNYFFQDYSYGTQAKYSPGDFFLNGGYGVWQFSGDRKLGAFPYESAFHNTWISIRHPVQAIDQFGWKEWLFSEVIPGSLEPKHGQFFPNYALHLLGAGMQSRKMEEWYRSHSTPYPRFWSFVTMTAEHFWEEVIEDEGTRGLSVDPVSDTYIFNIAGILLFSSDRVCRFFSDKTHLNEWSKQPSVDLLNGTLENMGQLYVMKIALERTSTWNFFSLFGMQEIFGISYMIDQERCLSGGAGVIVDRLRKVEDSESEQKAFTASFKWSTGIFYDANNSLLASLIVTGIERNLLRLNIYPGFAKIGTFSPGFFLAYSGSWSAGITFSCSPLGMAVGRPVKD